MSSAYYTDLQLVVRVIIRCDSTDLIELLQPLPCIAFSAKKSCHRNSPHIVITSNK